MENGDNTFFWLVWQISRGLLFGIWSRHNNAKINAADNNYYHNGSDDDLQSINYHDNMLSPLSASAASVGIF